MVWFSYVLMTLLMFSGLFLIALILLQRGRGGGLAGAFGGMGGQSAFGTKAGDVFTRITIGVAAAWILLCAGSVVALHNSSGNRFKGADDQIDAAAKADKEKAESRRGDDDDEDLSLPIEPAKTPDGVAPAVPGNNSQPSTPAKQDPDGGAKTDAQKPADPEKETPPAAPADPKVETKPDDAAKTDSTTPVPAGEKPADKPAESAPASEEKPK